MCRIVFVNSKIKLTRTRGWRFKFLGNTHQLFFPCCHEQIIPNQLYLNVKIFLLYSRTCPESWYDKTSIKKIQIDWTMLMVWISILGNSRKVLWIIEMRIYLVNLIQEFKERTEKQFDANIFYRFESLLKWILCINHRMRLLKTTFFVKKDF